MRQLAITAFAFAIAASTSALAQTAEQVLNEVTERRLAELQRVSTYLVAQRAAGRTLVLLYERVAGGDGSDGPAGYRLVPLSEIQQRIEAMAGLTPDLKREAAENAVQAMGEGFSAFGGNLPAGADMAMSLALMGVSQFLYAATPTSAQVVATIRADQADVRQSAADMAEFATTATLVGRESIGGRDAFHLRAEELNRRDGDFTLDAVSLFIDSELYVPLLLRMTGRSGAEAMTIERESSGYTTVGQYMVRPFREVMRIGGVLTEEQRQQISEAQGQIAALEAQLDALPPGPQKDMMTRMLGPQLDMIRNMAASGGTEVVTEYIAYRENATIGDFIAWTQQYVLSGP